MGRRLFCFLLAASLSAAAETQPEQPLSVTPEVYMFPGDTGEASRENRANTGNSSFILSDRAVIVVDTGASYRHGAAMISAIERLTDAPIRLVIVTHAVQDFLFGNAAFEERHIPVLSHAESAKLMRDRCEHCLVNLRQLLGDDAMRGTRLVLPDRVVAGSQPLKVAGRQLELFHFGWGATPGDLVVFDPRSAVLFAGGLVCVQRIPDLRDGRLEGWLAALEQLERIPAKMLIPGHGPAAPPSSISMMRAYLLALDEQVRLLYRSGRSLLEALDSADLPAFRDWAMYPALHRKNVQQRYLELELQDLEAR
jgi:glyoxylase-like metal-dependent hydrolase (beta-lactamase superfamily II)